MLSATAVAAAMRANRSAVVVLTGAGVSTDSGIPDYRGPLGDPRGYKAPVTFQLFMGSAEVRKRYWARSLAGFTALSRAQPNAFHHAVAALQQSGLVGAVVTQNVDRLHQKAGTKDVVELHGRVDVVECSACAASTMPRTEFHDVLVRLNPEFAVKTSTQLRPDGDADLDHHDFGAFKVPDCAACGAFIRPQVVFFGGSLDPLVKARAERVASSSRVLLVFGTSLEAYSALKLVRLASQAGAQVGIVNRGSTRADDLASLGRYGEADGAGGFMRHVMEEFRGEVALAAV